MQPEFLFSLLVLGTLVWVYPEFSAPSNPVPVWQKQSVAGAAVGASSLEHFQENFSMLELLLPYHKHQIQDIKFWSTTSWSTDGTNYPHWLRKPISL